MYSLRTQIAEGRLSYSVVEKDDDGKLVTVEKKMEGPTSFITTTIMEKLEPQLEDRLFTIHPDEGVEQTKNIISMTALQKAGQFSGVDENTVCAWKEFHKSLKPVRVVIPYATLIANFINRSSMVPITTRRAFNRVLSVIQAITCSYQHQRKKAANGYIIAEISDYFMAMQIVSEAFRENLGQQDRKSEDRLAIIEESGRMTPRALMEKLGITASGLSQWTSKKVKEGILTWCEEDGTYFSDDRNLKRAKHSGTAFLKLAENYNPTAYTGLPTPYDLTGDPDWDEGGKLLKLYDLELDKRCDKVFSSVNRVFIPDLNTSDGSEPVDSIPEFADEGAGVKVLSEKAGEKEIKRETPKQSIRALIRTTAKKADAIDEGASSKLANEFGSMLDDGVKRIGKVSMTPGICRTGCKHYDGVRDVNDGQFKEFCCQRGMTKIDEGRYCACFESKQPKLPEGVLPM